MKKNTRWTKSRHRVMRNLAYVILYPYARWKYGLTVAKYKDSQKRPYLVLYNHQTPFDQFFVGMSFSGAMYYLATEDIFSNGWVSNLIRWLVAPIPIKKQTTDVKAVKDCVRVAKEGGSLAIAPEGNRTYSGKTEYMSPSIASLAKLIKLPIALYRIEGGYGVQPRWSDVMRRGKMTAGVSRVIEPEEYQSLTNEELFALIQEELFVNEAVADGEFHHRKRAEYLERAVYVCPYCGLSVFESHNEVLTCTKCHRQVVYKPTKELEGVGEPFPFRFVNDWYEYQKEYVRNLDLEPYRNEAMYEDSVKLSEVIIRKCKKSLRNHARLTLYGNRIEIDGGYPEAMVLPFEEISVAAVLGKNKLNIYHKSAVYQIKGSKRFNALKYVNVFYHYKSCTTGEKDGEFLGL